MKMVLHQFSEYYIVKYDKVKKLANDGKLILKFYHSNNQFSYFYKQTPTFTVKITDINLINYDLIADVEFNISDEEIKRVIENINLIAVFNITNIEGDLISVDVDSADYYINNFDILELRKRKLKKLMHK